MTDDQGPAHLKIHSAPAEVKRKLQTIQTRHNLNLVLAVGGNSADGAAHTYEIAEDQEQPADPKADWPKAVFARIRFQEGPRDEEGSVRGVLDTDLLEIVRDRLRGFQTGEFATHENAMAIAYIEEALYELNARVEDRAARGVLGTKLV